MKDALLPTAGTNQREALEWAFTTDNTDFADICRLGGFDAEEVRRCLESLLSMSPVKRRVHFQKIVDYSERHDPLEL